MTAEELIEELKKYPSNLEIYLSNGMMNDNDEMLTWKILSIFNTKNEDGIQEICIAFSAPK